jgi:hypothetical protein
MKSTRRSTAAQNYVDKQMVPADLVAVVSLGNTLTVNQDFTSDRALLKKALQGVQSWAPAPGFEEGQHRLNRRHIGDRRILHRGRY